MTVWVRGVREHGSCRHRIRLIGSLRFFSTCHPGAGPGPIHPIPDMPRNVEIKARVRQPDRLLDAVLELADRGPTLFAQDDTFFACPNGRLKLRAFSDAEGQLIFYRRDDREGPTLSEYMIAKTSEPDALRATLTLAYGATGRVKKTRTLCIVGQTRVHLDDVEGLGHYMELEVVLAPEQSVDDGRAIAEALMTRLGIGPESLVTRAYVDLIARKKQGDGDAD